MAPQQFQHPGYGGEHGDAVPLDELDEAGRIQPGLEVDLGREERRHPKSHELPEDVRERKGVKEAERMERSLVASVSVRSRVRWGRARRAHCRGCGRCLWARRWCRR